MNIRSPFRAYLFPLVIVVLLAGLAYSAYLVRNGTETPPASATVSAFTPGQEVELRELVRLPVGTRLKAQIQGLPSPAPVLEMEIQRTDERGAGLLFILDDARG